MNRIDTLGYTSLEMPSALVKRILPKVDGSRWSNIFIVICILFKSREEVELLSGHHFFRNICAFHYTFKLIIFRTTLVDPLDCSLLSLKLQKWCQVFINFSMSQIFNTVIWAIHSKICCFCLKDTINCIEMM